MFPIKRPVSLEDEDAVIDAKDYDRFVVARAGDHLMVQFQCDLCHFRNIQRLLLSQGLFVIDCYCAASGVLTWTLVGRGSLRQWRITRVM